MPKRFSIAFMSLAAATAVIVGCGSDEVTRADYRVATGEVCDRYEKVIQKDQREISSLSAQSAQNPEPFVKVVRQFQRDWDEFVAAMKAIERPSADQAQLDKFYEALSVSQDNVADLATAVDQLPGLVEDARSVQESQDVAEARALIRRASEVQREVQQTEIDLQDSINQVERITDSYPGLAECRS